MSVRSDLPPLSLYVHIPWCIRKCPYCDFNSHAVVEPVDEAGYVSALLNDLDSQLSWVADRQLESVFIGGGTPSLFSGESIGRLLQGVARRLGPIDGVEVTLEANPGSLESGRYAAYRSAGVNRLSIGVQSFDPDCLRRLGRIHGPDESVAAIASAKAAGFDRINIDLMYALPGQTVESAGRDLDLAISFEPGHISYYELTLEPNTYFYAHPPQRPTERVEEAIQRAGMQRLQAAGYKRYEVSAFAAESHQCRHNLNYWEFGDYLGIGAGAHGKLSRSAPMQIWRTWQHKSPARYMAQQREIGSLAGQRRLGESDLLIEYLMNALRLQRGFSLQEFESRTGLSADSLMEAIAASGKQHLVQLDRGVLRASAEGGRFLDDLLAAMI